MNGYYTRFAIIDRYPLPPKVRAALEAIWDQHCTELGDDNHDAIRGRLGVSIDRITSLLLETSDGRARCFGLSLALACAATIESYDAYVEQAIKLIDTLRENETTSNSSFLHLLTKHELLELPQAAAEAWLVLHANVDLRTSADQREAIRLMIESCIDGYAIVPGSEGRRDLFNWMLVDVIPAACRCELAKRIYTLEWPWPPIN